MIDLIRDDDAVAVQFEKVAPLVEDYRRMALRDFGPEARVSTCFLLDDYFGPEARPSHIIDKIRNAAEDCELVIDYLAREAGCWESKPCHDGLPLDDADPIKLAEMVSEYLVAEPDRQSNGRRPATKESGWLCNGQRSSDVEPAQAMRPGTYEFPEEFGRREHSIFLDIQLWSESIKPDGSTLTKWSCPYLAAIWQLLRLGLLRHDGEPPVVPQPWRAGQRWPERWWDMPAVVQLNPNAKPFAAYRALSILPHQYLRIESAVRVILDHIALDPDVVKQLVDRGQLEGFDVPESPTERIAHMMLFGS